jgi:DNA polymerase-3 subunit epsilon
MRQIVVDTETTGRPVEGGHRIIEIGCLVLEDRRISDLRYQTYLNPGRASEAGALAVHGLSEAFLSDKPLFSDIAEALLAFLQGAELIIHNAPFDVSFLDYELKQASVQYGKLADYCKITDSLTLARRLHPGQRNSLDALCKRYAIDNSHRNLHGALLDAELLARVWLRMTSGQPTLFGESDSGSVGDIGSIGIPFKAAHITQTTRLPAIELPIVPASTEELATHKARLAAIAKVAGRSVWENPL